MALLSRWVGRVGSKAGRDEVGSPGHGLRRGGSGGWGGGANSVFGRVELVCCSFWYAVAGEGGAGGEVKQSAATSGAGGPKPPGGLVDSAPLGKHAESQGNDGQMGLLCVDKPVLGRVVPKRYTSPSL